MSELPRNQQDFSDIDNLGRATESFMKEQRKALEQRRSVRAPRNHTTWFGAHIKQISVTAALVLVCGLAAFFGIRFAAGHDDLRQPEPETTVSDTTAGTEAEPEPESTEPPAGSETERQMPAVTPNNTERQSASTTATRDTTADDGQNATTPSVSTRRTEPSAKQPSEQIPASTSVSTTPPRSGSVQIVTQPSSTASTSRTTTSTSRTTASTSRTTASTSRTTASTSRTTASTSKTTASTSRTTASTSKTTVTTTQPAQAKLDVLSVRVRDGYTDSSGKYRQTVRVFLRNTGNAAFSGSKSLSIAVTGCSSIQHVGCTTGNARNISYSGSGITLTYAYSGLAVNADDTVTLTVISDKPITSVRLA